MSNKWLKGTYKLKILVRSTKEAKKMNKAKINRKKLKGAEGN